MKLLTDAQKQEIRTLALAGVSQTDISRRLKIYRGTVRKVLRSFNLPTRPVIPKEKIRAMTIAGIRQSVIARRLKLTAPTVSKVQRSFNLPTHIVIPEEQIMELFRAGWGGYRIHRHLKIPVNQIYAVAHKNNFRRADGIGYPELHGNVAGFIEALKRREGYIRPLAKKYGVGFCQALKIAHEVLQTYRFCPGPSQPPLSSAFPQRHHEKRVSAD